MTSARLLILPGWLDSGPAHWQSHWQSALDARRVEQADWERPLRGDWMARLDEVIADDASLDASPAVLVAHSLGCHLVAAWAGHSRWTARVRGALLVAPPDLARADMPLPLHSWRRLARARLPFPATLVFSPDDPFCSAESAQRFAAEWGAQAVEIDACGHINGDSGLGEWAVGQTLLRALCSEA